MPTTTVTSTTYATAAPNTAAAVANIDTANADDSGVSYPDDYKQRVAAAVAGLA